MYSDILKYLKCPSCGEEVKIIGTPTLKKGEIVEGAIGCCNDHKWFILEGVLNFQSKPQLKLNAWSEYYKKVDYEELEQQILSKTPDNLKLLYDKTKVYISDYINKLKPNLILDIYSGRASLAALLSKHLHDDTNVITTDSNFEALKYARHKVKLANPYIKMNFITCSAENLPIKDSSIDLCTSYFSFVRMLNSLQKGLKESKRVLKSTGELLHSTILLEKNNCKLNELHNNFIKDYKFDKIVECVTKDGLETLYKTAGYKTIDFITVGEDIGQKNELDIIPIEGERFSISLIKGY